MTLASLPAPLLAALPAPLLAALPAQRSPSADPSPTVSPDCHQDLVCETVFAVTGLPWLAETSFWIFIKPIRIALIIIVTMVVRYLLHRAINRLVRGSSQAPAPTILRPLRERVRSAIQEGRVLPERRRQRAEAIGSVLRSLVTAVVFSIAFLLVLSELNFNLAPLLASAGIVGVALGFGAQTLVKDLIAGLFMLLEDQYGVGDTVVRTVAKTTAEGQPGHAARPRRDRPGRRHLTPTIGAGVVAEKRWSGTARARPRAV